ncbi:MAG: sodium:solute symporter family protein, partial [Proteobacteria bacterium]
SGLLGIDQKQALVAVLLFVFSYVLMGGTYAHAYTNALQGLLMLFVSVGLFVHGWHYFDGQPLAALESVGSDYAAVFNPSSNLYFSMFSVFTSGFIITFALMLQPHILTKVLYLKDERDTRIFLITAIGSGTLFMLILFVGFYAKLAGYDIEAQDAVVTQYLLEETSHSAAGQYVRAFIFVALLAAGMSTLDGILVALSAMIVTDVLEPAGLNAERGLQVARWVLVVIGLIALALAWNPPPIVGLFAQKGVYGLAAASFVPIVFAAFFKTRLSPSTIGLAAFVGLGTHLSLNMLLGVANPSISATYGIFAASAVGVLGLLTKRLRREA